VPPAAFDPGLRLPAFAAGMRIGLFGGSFDPPHAGHLAVSQTALRALGLDQVWWLVSPQNPLKPNAPGDVGARIAAARAIVTDPRIKVTGVEAAFGSIYTANTLRRLLPRLRGAQPVWLMGADAFAGFHRWKEWQAIAASIPIAVLNRPGWAQLALSSPAATSLRRWRVDATDAQILPGMPPPAWIFLPFPQVNASSTALRATPSRVLKASL
jgi:nicotinate-nucleotide adenylyltransferase